MLSKISVSSLINSTSFFLILSFICFPEIAKSNFAAFILKKLFLICLILLKALSTEGLIISSIDVSDKNSSSSSSLSEHHLDFHQLCFYFLYY